MKEIKKILVLFMCLVFILNGNIIAFAEESNDSAKDVKAFEQMADNYMKKAMEKYKVPNLTLSVVKDGKIFFKKGYGYADIEKKIPVDPDTTGFEIGSITKLFTATAAMQLVEQGKLKPNEDVNNYLSDFKIKNKFSTPVTLKNLLTHTAGFDEEVFNILDLSDGTTFYENVEPLEKVLKRTMPSVIRKPGTCVQYSNHGVALVGYLVQKISGIPFDKYITDNIFNPLDMENSSYFLNKNIINSMAKPYKYEKGKFVNADYSLVTVHPAGSICSTATDMAKFMMMQLNNGEYNGHKILMADTAKQMHSTNFTNDKHLPGYDLGFYEAVRNGNKVIEHGGDTMNFHSQLSMLPEKNIGFFLSFSNGRPEVIEDFTNEFYKFFTSKGVAESTPVFNNMNEISSLDIKKIEGNYTDVRYPHGNILKIQPYMQMNETKIKVDNLGNVVLPLTKPMQICFNTKKSKLLFKHVENLSFYNSEINQYLKFIEQDGKTYLILGLMVPMQAMEKVPNINIYLLYIVIFGILVGIAGVVVALISLIKKKYANCEKPVLILKITLLILSVLLIIYPMSYMLFGMVSEFTIPYICYLINGICYVTFLATIVFSIYNIIAWKNKYFSIKTKIFYSMVCLIGIANLCFMYIMNAFKFI